MSEGAADAHRADHADPEWVEAWEWALGEALESTKAWEARRATVGG